MLETERLQKVLKSEEIKGGFKFLVHSQRTLRYFTQVGDEGGLFQITLATRNLKTAEKSYAEITRNDWPLEKGSA